MKNQSISKASSDPAKNCKYPVCINKREARMVCLNEICPDYAFFCLTCQDQSCESVHRHENKADKLVAISFKEFLRRVLKQKKPIEELETSINTYKQTLMRLRADINEFVQKQLENLNEIRQKVNQVPQDILPTIKKLKEGRYQGLIGKEMSYLWQNCGQSQQSIKIQQEKSDFIRIKEEELKGISEHFQNLNRMNFETAQEGKTNQNTKIQYHKNTGSANNHYPGNTRT